MNRKGKITAIEINEIKNALKYGYIHYRELDSFFRNNLLGSDPLMIRTYVEEITFKVVKTIEDNINSTKLPDNATRNYYYKLYQYIKRSGTIFRIIDDVDKLREVRNGREVYEHLSYLLAEGKYNKEVRKSNKITKIIQSIIEKGLQEMQKKVSSFVFGLLEIKEVENQRDLLIIYVLSTLSVDQKEIERIIKELDSELRKGKDANNNNKYLFQRRILIKILDIYKNFLN